jgi:hypothetical protein
MISALNKIYFRVTQKPTATAQDVERLANIEQLVDALNVVTGCKGKSMPKDYPSLYKQFSATRGHPLNEVEKAAAYKYIDTLTIDKNKRNQMISTLNNNYFRVTQKPTATAQDVERPANIKQLVDALNVVTGDKDKSMPKDYPSLSKQFSATRGHPLNEVEKATAYKYIDTLTIDKNKRNQMLSTLNNNYFRVTQKPTNTAQDVERSTNI